MELIKYIMFFIAIIASINICAMRNGDDANGKYLASTLDAQTQELLAAGIPLDEIRAQQNAVPSAPLQPPPPAYSAHDRRYVNRIKSRELSSNQNQIDRTISSYLGVAHNGVTLDYYKSPEKIFRMPDSKKQPNANQPSLPFSLMTHDDYADALFRACRNNSLLSIDFVIKAILKREGSLDVRLNVVQDNTSHLEFIGDTPLIIAARLGHAEIVKKLVDAGADLFRKNALGVDVVQAGAQHAQVLEILRAAIKEKPKAVQQIKPLTFPQPSQNTDQLLIYQHSVFNDMKPNVIEIEGLIAAGVPREEIEASLKASQSLLRKSSPLRRSPHIDDFNVVHENRFLNSTLCSHVQQKNLGAPSGIIIPPQFQELVRQLQADGCSEEDIAQVLKMQMGSAQPEAPIMPQPQAVNAQEISDKVHISIAYIGTQCGCIVSTKYDMQKIQQLTAELLEQFDLDSLEKMRLRDSITCKDAELREFIKSREFGKVLEALKQEEKEADELFKRMFNAVRNNQPQELSTIVQTINEMRKTTLLKDKDYGHMPYWSVDIFVPEKDIKKQESLGDTALIIACRNGFYDCAQVLLEAGAMVKTSNARRESPTLVAKTEDIESLLYKFIK